MATVAVTNAASQSVDIELTAKPINTDDNDLKSTPEINPETHASCCSKMFFSWLGPILALGAKR